MIKAFPKIFAIGTDYIRDIFNEPVELSEKVDGSQMAFGLVENNLFMRSKGAQLYADNPEKMFKEGIDYVVSIQGLLPDGVIFYGEYLKHPKHNTLKYNRVPRNHIILFGSGTVAGDSFNNMFEEYSDILGLEVVPKEFHKISSADDLKLWLDRESILGGTKVEGVVAKNYTRKFLLGGMPMPMMCGKFVSEAYKETHRDRWGKEETGKGRFETFCESFRTEARWHKAIQHLDERGELTNSPKDIGKLLKEINEDIETEEQDSVKNFLWKEYKRDIMRAATGGFPEWYKNMLLERSFTQ
jgi:hypothetical protein